MSLHVNLSHEVEAKLRSQRRRSTVSSVLVALFSSVLVCMLLGLYMLKPILIEPNTFVIYEQKMPGDEPDEPVKVRTWVKQKPAVPASAATNPKVIASSLPSPVSFPKSEIAVEEPPVDFGDSDDFGDGWQNGEGDGFGPGGGGGFGSRNGYIGGLMGYLYDLKQDAEGKALPYSHHDLSTFAEPAKRIEESGFSHSVMGDFYRAPIPLYLTWVAIPETSAAKGPELFQAKDMIKPSGWMAVYRGKIVAPKTGEFRFVGIGDDYMVVRVDGKPRLFAALKDLNDAVRGDWEGSKPAGAFKGPYKNRPLEYGDWIEMRRGQEMEIEVALGERPGGEVWFVLMVEEKGVKYAKAEDGRPILPLFTTVPFSNEEVIDLKEQFGKYEFDFEKVPVFGVRER